MPKVIIDMTMSLDGFVAGPNDGPKFPLGQDNGMRIFDWYMSGPRKSGDLDILHPEPGVNQAVVDEMFAESGAFIFGRRHPTSIANGWGGRHPVNGVPVFVLTHKPPPPETVPQGPSNLTFVTDGIASAVGKAKAVAGKKHVKLGGASPGKQALAEGTGRRDPGRRRAVPPRRRRPVVRARPATRSSRSSRCAEVRSPRTLRYKGRKKDNARGCLQILLLVVYANQWVIED